MTHEVFSNQVYINQTTTFMNNLHDYGVKIIYDNFLEVFLFTEGKPEYRKSARNCLCDNPYIEAFLRNSKGLRRLMFNPSCFEFPNTPWENVPEDFKNEFQYDTLDTLDWTFRRKVYDAAALFDYPYNYYDGMDRYNRNSWLATIKTLSKTKRYEVIYQSDLVDAVYYIYTTDPNDYPAPIAKIWL